MTSSVLPKISDAVEERQKEQLDRHDHWTVSLDGWTDITSNSIYAVMILDIGEQQIFGELEFGEDPSYE